jgi:tryptophan halogenase
MAELAAQNGVAPPAGAARAINMNIGRTRRSWVDNCVGIGLAAGFIEPLESTSLHFVQMSIRWLLDNFPDRGRSPALQNNFNGLTSNLYEEIRDFIALHYVLNNRDDSPFWRFARNELKCPDRLAGLLDLWRHKLPTVPDLPNRNTLFSEWRYMYILFGKHYFDGIDFPTEDAIHDSDFDEFQFGVAQDRNRLMAEAPDHRATIREIRESTSPT